MGFRNCLLSGFAVTPRERKDMPWVLIAGAIVVFGPVIAGAGVGWRSKKLINKPCIETDVDRLIALLADVSTAVRAAAALKRT
jgi:hypothetical protein